VYIALPILIYFNLRNTDVLSGLRPRPETTRALTAGVFPG
jgi:hypothetical protein